MTGLGRARSPFFEDAGLQPMTASNPFYRSSAMWRMASITGEGKPSTTALVLDKVVMVQNKAVKSHSANERLLRDPKVLHANNALSSPV